MPVCTLTPARRERHAIELAELFPSTVARTACHLVCAGEERCTGGRVMQSAGDRTGGGRGGRAGGRPCGQPGAPRRSWQAGVGGLPAGQAGGRADSFGALGGDTGGGAGRVGPAGGLLGTGHRCARPDTYVRPATRVLPKGHRGRPAARPASRHESCQRVTGAGRRRAWVCAIGVASNTHVCRPCALCVPALSALWLWRVSCFARYLAGMRTSDARKKAQAVRPRRGQASPLQPQTRRL